MLVSITGVKVSTAPKGYSVAEVTYSRDGKEESRKIMSFVNQEVFKAVSGFKTFPVDVNIVLAKELNKKDGKEYWQWKAIETGVSNDATSKAGPPAKAFTSNYETPAERAKRQVYIVRQSSLANAIAYFAALEPKGISVTTEGVIETANQFANYVLDVSEEPNVT